MSAKTQKSKAQKPSKGHGKVVAAHISARGPRARRAPRQDRAQQTVDVIVEAAGQLLVKKGRAAVTTNAVAERAGVSIGSLYQYFSGKESIFGALHERHREEVMPLIHRTIEGLDDPSIDLVDAIITLMRAMAEIHRSAPARMRALADHLHDDPSPAELEQFVEATVRSLSKRTGRSEVSLRAIAWLTCVTVSEVGRTLVHQPPEIDLEDLLQGLGRMLRGLLGDIAIPMQRCLP
jgi:AcrR family transcriptional regulator